MQPKEIQDPPVSVVQTVLYIMPNAGLNEAKVAVTLSLRLLFTNKVSSNVLKDSVLSY